MAKFSVVIQSDAYKNLINNTLGDKEVARQFIADISTVVAQNPALQNCDPATIVSAGLVAQTLKLPLSSNLGFAYLVPYNNKNGLPRATFQVGYKGLTQLALRSGQFERLGVREVHEGEYAGQDEFGDDLFRFSHDYDLNKTIGYYAYFKLTNGFKKTLYWTKEQVQAHAKRYSRSYGNNKGTDLWSDAFDLMACKTVLKLLLNRYAPLSVELQKAIQSDQAVIGQDGTYEYVDNQQEEKKSTITNQIVDENGEIVPQVAEKKSKKAEVAKEEAVEQQDNFVDIDEIFG